MISVPTKPFCHLIRFATQNLIYAKLRIIKLIVAWWRLRHDDVDDISTLKSPLQNSSPPLQIIVQ